MLLRFTRATTTTLGNTNMNFWPQNVRRDETFVIQSWKSVGLYLWCWRNKPYTRNILWWETFDLIYQDCWPVDNTDISIYFLEKYIEGFEELIDNIARTIIINLFGMNSADWYYLDEIKSTSNTHARWGKASYYKTCLLIFFEGRLKAAHPMHSHL